MYSLLPEQNIKAIQREYRLRLVAVFVCFLAVVLVIGAFALVPSYILSREQESQAQSNVASMKQQRAAKGVDQNERDLISAQALITAAKQHSDGTALSAIVEHIVAHHVAGVLVTSFAINREATSTALIQMSGLAMTRERLVAFKKELERDPAVKKVELPVSDLAKSKDIQYNILVTLAL